MHDPQDVRSSNHFSREARDGELFERNMVSADVILKSMEHVSTMRKYIKPCSPAVGHVIYTGHSEATLAKLRMHHKRDKGPRLVTRVTVTTYRSVNLEAWLESDPLKGWDLVSSVQVRRPQKPFLTT